MSPADSRFMEILVDCKSVVGDSFAVLLDLGDFKS